MSVTIHVPADEVWSFFQKNRYRLSEEMVVIAENPDTEYAVYLTEDDGYPLFSVCKGNSDSEYEEGAINQRDCTDTAQRCYANYLFPIVVSSGSKHIKSELEDDSESGKELAPQEIDDIIFERDDELIVAMGDFILTAIQDGCDGSDIVDTYGLGVVEDILDHTLQYIAAQHGFPVYRPTLMVDESGKEVYVEYPYNEPEEEELADSLSHE